MHQLMFKIIFFLILIAATVNTVSAVPMLPMLVSGNVSINGEPAPAGTYIKAVIDGQVKGSSILSGSGVYGIMIESGNGVVELYVNDVKVNSIEWSNEPVTQDLSAAITPPSKTNLTNRQQTTAARGYESWSSSKTETSHDAEAADDEQAVTIDSNNKSTSDIKSRQQEDARKQNVNTAVSPGFSVFISILSIVVILWRVRNGKE